MQVLAPEHASQLARPGAWCAALRPPRGGQTASKPQLEVSDALRELGWAHEPECVARLGDFSLSLDMGERVTLTLTLILALTLARTPTLTLTLTRHGPEGPRE